MVQLLQQGRDVRGVIDFLVRQIESDDLITVGVDADTKLTPGSAFRSFVFLEQPFASSTKLQSRAVAPAQPNKGQKKRGRPKCYGKKIKLKSLLSDTRSMQQVASPVYGERNVTLRYCVRDLLWRRGGSSVLWPSFIPQGGHAN